MEVINDLASLSIGQRAQFIFMIVAFVFMIFSFVGWIMEVFFRRYVSQKRWVNPGFLKGPCLPIYGIGAVSLTGFIFLMLLVKDYFVNEIFFSVVVILGIGILMTLIELVGGLIFICGMHIRLWDYSNCKFNYKGIICLEFSIIWTVLGAVFYYFLFNPIVDLIAMFITLDWFIIAVFLMGIYYGCFIIDFIESLGIANKIKELAKEYEVVLKFEKFKVFVQDKISSNELISFGSKKVLNLKEHFSAFVKDQGEKIEKIIKTNKK